MYYNQITKKYHINKKKAQEIIESIEYTEDCFKRFKDYAINTESYLKIVNNLKDHFDFSSLTQKLQSGISNELIQLENQDIENIKLKIELLTNDFILLFIKKDYSFCGLDTFDDKDLKNIHHIFDSLLGDFNTMLGLGIYPRYISKFYKNEMNK